MSGPTPFDKSGLPLFTEESPGIVQLADLLDYINEMRDLYYETQQALQEAQSYHYFKSVEEFGIIGDGVTDETSKLQVAVDSLNANDVLFIPNNKTLLIKNKIFINKPIHVMGGKILFEPIPSNEEKILFDVNRNIASTSQVMNGVTFEGVRFKSNVVDNSNELATIFIRTWYCENIKITKCDFSNANIAIRPQLSKRITIALNHFENLYQTNTDKINGYGVMSETNEIMNVSNNIFTNVERHSVYLNHFKHVNVIGNIFKGDKTYVARTGYEMPIKITDGINVIVKGNIFDGTVGGISILEFGAGVLPSENINIHGNLFNDYAINNSIVTGFIFLKSKYLKDVKVSGNVFKYPMNHHIQYTGSGDVEITDNTFVGGQQGVRVETDSSDARLTISRNRFVDLSSNLITATNTNAKIFGQNNGFKNCQSGVATFTSNPNNMIVIDTIDIDNPGTKSLSQTGSTPDVKINNVFKINNSTVTNITNFIGASKDQRITVFFTNGNNILKHSGTLNLKGKVDVTTELGMIKQFLQIDYGSWYEI